MKSCVVDVNECQLTPGICGANAICEDLQPPSKYRCTCEAGYKPKSDGTAGCEGMPFMRKLIVMV